MEKTLAPVTTTEIVFKENDLLPTNTLGGQINWSKVFQETTGLFHPKSVNRNQSINEKGDFDKEKFILSRSNFSQKRERYLEQLKKQEFVLNRLATKVDMDGDEFLYYIEDSLAIAIKNFKEMFFLGNKNSKVYEKDFFVNLEEIQTLIKKGTGIEQKEEGSRVHNEILQNIEAGLVREQEERPKYVQQLNKNYQEMINKYSNEDKSLNVDKILEDLKSHWTRNEEAMLIAFYTSTCSKEELARLQEGTIEALNQHIKKLDTPKVFIILEWILPYIYEGVNFDFNIPEIFRPEYLNHISIYDLTLEKFTDQIRSKGPKYNRSQEVQDKLIEQFKEFGTNKDGNIGFGQGSEQLRYWQSVTGRIDEKNFKNYLKDSDLGDEKKPRPKILDGYKNLEQSEEILNVLNEKNE
ncbi:MAG: hypothetical protein WCO66_02795 [Candidatus Absconditabacteria bacterium]